MTHHFKVGDTFSYFNDMYTIVSVNINNIKREIVCTLGTHYKRASLFTNIQSPHSWIQYGKSLEYIADTSMMHKDVLVSGSYSPGFSDAPSIGPVIQVKWALLLGIFEISPPVLLDLSEHVKYKVIV